MTGDPFLRYRTNPIAFIEEILGIHLYSRQREIVEAVRDHERVAVRSGNATGKTTAAACVMLAWLAGGPGSTIVSTASTQGQLERVLWRETRRRFKGARGFFDGAVVTNTEIRLRSRLVRRRVQHRHAGGDAGHPRGARPCRRGRGVRRGRGDLRRHRGLARGRRRARPPDREPAPHVGLVLRRLSLAS